MGTDAVLRGLAAAGLRVPVVVTASALVYRQSTEALTEDSPLGPSGPYGVSKLAQEMVALAAGAEHGLDVLVTRAFNQIGPGQSPAFAAASFARQLARIDAGLDASTIKVGNLEAERDISDVRDTVRAYAALMARGRPGECYNVCTGDARSMQAVLDGLRRRVGRPVEVVQDPARMRPSDTPRVVGSRAKLTADTGWAPRFSFDETLDALLEFWRQEVQAGRA
jgi:GDP-4-dehydro-6-deoxy-D-mannose reductase